MQLKGKKGGVGPHAGRGGAEGPRTRRRAI